MQVYIVRRVRIGFWDKSTDNPGYRISRNGTAISTYEKRRKCNYTEKTLGFASPTYIGQHTMCN